MSGTYPKYEIVVTVTGGGDSDSQPFSVLETIETWNGPRTYIRQRGFRSVREAIAEIRKRGGDIDYD